MSSTDSVADFEKSLQKLEEIVTKMEQGSLSLEQSLEAFEEGVQLTRQCQTTLKEAEQRVSTLTKEGEGYTLSDFNNALEQ